MTPSTAESSEEYRFYRDYVSLGQKKLLPPRISRQFDRIEGRARECLLTSSYQTAWGPFVPCTAYPRWKGRIEELRDEYFQQKDAFLADLDTVKDEVRTIYRQAGQVAYKRLNAIPAEREVEVPKAFVENFADRIVGLIPPAEALEGTFTFEYFPFDISRQRRESDLIETVAPLGEGRQMRLSLEATE